MTLCSDCGNDCGHPIACTKCWQARISLAAKTALDEGMNASDSIYEELVKALLQAGQNELNTIHALILTAKRWGCRLDYGDVMPHSPRTTIRSFCYDIVLDLLLECGAETASVLDTTVLDFELFKIRDNKPLTPINEEFDKLLLSDEPVEKALKLIERWKSEHEAAGVMFSDADEDLCEGPGDYQ